MNIIKINPQPYEGDLNIAQSKMWGSADLPHTFKYPTYEDEEGDDCHYVFVAQINCEEVAPFDKENRLPHTGMLYFFAKIDYYMGEFLAEPMCDGFWDLGDVKVLYYPKNDYENFERIILIDDEDQEIAPKEQRIVFESLEEEGESLVYDHKLLGRPAYLADDVDFDKYALLFQLDSCDIQEGMTLNFMDWGQLLFLIPVKDFIGEGKKTFKNVVGYLASS